MKIFQKPQFIFKLTFSFSFVLKRERAFTVTHITAHRKPFFSLVIICVFPLCFFLCGVVWCVVVRRSSTYSRQDIIVLRWLHFSHIYINKWRSVVYVEGNFSQQGIPSTHIMCQYVWQQLPAATLCAIQRYLIRMWNNRAQQLGRIIRLSIPGERKMHHHINTGKVNKTVIKTSCCNDRISSHNLLQLQLQQWAELMWKIAIHSLNFNGTVYNKKSAVRVWNLQTQLHGESLPLRFRFRFSSR